MVGPDNVGASSASSQAACLPSSRVSIEGWRAEWSYSKGRSTESINATSSPLAKSFLQVGPRPSKGATLHTFRDSQRPALHRGRAARAAAGRSRQRSQRAERRRRCGVCRAHDESAALTNRDGRGPGNGSAPMPEIGVGVPPSAVLLEAGAPRGAPFRLPFRSAPLPGAARRRRFARSPRGRCELARW